MYSRICESKQLSLSRLPTNLDYRQWCTWQDALLRLSFIQESDVVIHIVNVTMTQSLDIFEYIDTVLQIRVLPVSKDWIIHHDTINARVIICIV